MHRRELKRHGVRPLLLPPTHTSQFSTSLLMGSGLPPVVGAGGAMAGMAAHDPALAGLLAGLPSAAAAAAARVGRPYSAKLLKQLQVCVRPRMRALGLRAHGSRQGSRVNLVSPEREKTATGAG